MLLPLAILTSEPIVRWVGREMALAGGNAVVTDETVISGFAGSSAVIWEHADVPFWQFVELDIELQSGRVCRLLSQIDEGSGHHGFFLIESERTSESDAAEEGSILRTRELTELPIGLAGLEVVGKRGPGSVTEIALSVGHDVIRLLAAEVHEQCDGSLKIVENDESILLQLNGRRPTSA